jgi:hypothetical protein
MEQQPDHIIETLSKFVKIRPKEKYPESVGKHIVFSSIDEVLGKDYAKQRISERKIKKIYDLILTRMKARYGSWVNILDFRIRGPFNRITFSTNFEKIYNTEMGSLFGTANSSPIWRNVLFTTHCLERFEQRTLGRPLTHLKDNFKKVCKAEPTSADLLLYLIFLSDFKYGPVKPEEYYLNVRAGACIMESFDDVTVVKTFVTPNMVKNVTWFQPDLTQEEETCPSKHFESLRQILHHHSKKVDPPDFSNAEKMTE